MYRQAEIYNLIFDYEQAILQYPNEKASKVPFKILFKGSSGQNKRELGVIIRHIVIDILGWNPYDCLDHFTDAILEMTLITRMLKCTGYTKDDLPEVLSFAFPKELPYDRKRAVIDALCKKAHLGKWAYDPREYRLPKDFFTGVEGNEAVNICMRFLVTEFLIENRPTNSPRDVIPQSAVPGLYQFFAAERKAKIWLKKHGMDHALLAVERLPLRLLHGCLSYDECDNFLYLNYLIEDAYKKVFPESPPEKPITKEKAKKKGLSH